MKIATVTVKGTGRYSQSQPFEEIKDRNETHAAFETRMWRKRCHVDEDGMLFIPPQAFKNCLSEAARYKSIKIPGKGNATYTKHFEGGVQVMKRVPLGIKLDDVKSERLFAPADGKRGSGKRVWKTFPYVDRGWQAEVEFLIVDDIVDETVFRQHLEDAGRFIGIGRFRPRNNGYYGTFEVVNFEWQELN